MAVDIAKELAEARRKLLDLTARNRLLNHKPRKRSIRIIDEIPREVFGTLVIDEKSMGFIPAERKTKTSKTGEYEDADDVGFEQSDLWEMPPPEEGLAARHRDRNLQTGLQTETLHKSLFAIDKEAQEVMEEQGYTILYLALAFLEWQDSRHTDQIFRAPLILIPIEIGRTKVKSAYRISWTGEDIYTNISLQEKLYEQQISLPDFEMPENKEAISDYLAQVQQAIITQPSWRITSDIYLDFFSFTKFVMYKDLDPQGWPEGRHPMDHPLIKEILDPEGSEFPSGDLFPEDEIDDRLELERIYHVMDADPTQIAVIEDMKSGHNLVVEGPPGTGKSQTITNVIAELLAADKTVLFVSEKMAALGVVKERLDQVGLGEFCLELHSRKSNKKELLQEIRRSIESRSPVAINAEREFAVLANLRNDLNEYARSLRQPINPIGLSPWQLFGWKEEATCHFETVGKGIPSVGITGATSLSIQNWHDAEGKLDAYVQGLSLISSPVAHPWRGCRPGVVTPADQSEVLSLIDSCCGDIVGLQNNLSSLKKITGITRPNRLLDCDKAIKAAEVVAISTPIDKKALLGRFWNHPKGVIASLLKDIEVYQKNRSALGEIFFEEVFDRTDIGEILDEYEEFSSRLFRIFYSRYRFLRNTIKAWYKITPPNEIKSIIADVFLLNENQKLQHKISSKSETGEGLFGELWADENSDLEMLKQIFAWVYPFRQMVGEKAIANSAVDIIQAGANKDGIRREIEVTGDAIKSTEANLVKLSDKLGANWHEIHEASYSELPFQELLILLENWKTNLHLLQSWSQYVLRRESCSNTPVENVVQMANKGQIQSADLMPCARGSLADILLREAFINRPALTEFVGELHENKISEFAALDRRMIEINRQRLAHKLHTSRPILQGGASSGSEAGILLGQLNRKRGHMPIRKLLSNVGGLIQKIKPCFMMSPLSVAQFLDPRVSNFDVIIFDEASQVRPEDAIGALLRGNQVGIYGDTNQLPPTGFFDRIIDSDEVSENDETTGIAAVESILHKCRMSFPYRRLGWHYRSQHESLIAVSNVAFYDSSLRIYPSAIDNDDELGLKFLYLPDTVYDRGKSRINRKEAQAVAALAIRHYEQNPEISLGIGTFSVGQQQAIWEEIEFLLRDRPDIEDFFKKERHEHFFVKNLETIQGDERDVILVSVGYGFDREGVLSRNFGPVNQDGGERRLNVLMTRARRKCVIIANFRASDLSIEPTMKRGVTVLKMFLSYAESRNIDTHESVRAESDSPFEDSVKDFLESNGYEVRSQVGCAGFRIDLGLVNPEHRGCYFLGIECDGASYHSSRIARDRDRLRQQILEGLGWKIYRIWSTDWYRNRVQAQKRLLAAVEEHRIISAQTLSSMQKNISKNREKQEGGKCDGIVRMDYTRQSEQNGQWNELAQEYIACSKLGISMHGEIHDRSISELAKAVESVVSVESPVHVDEVIRRIRTLWGLKRSGNRIREALRTAMEFAKQHGMITIEDEFCYNPKAGSIVVRCRIDDPSPDIELISIKEIAEAIKSVLMYQHGTLDDELTTQTAKLLGFRATNKQTYEHIKAVLDTFLADGTVMINHSGSITLG
jgi:very-short-patch-repair endonuclease